MRQGWYEKEQPNPPHFPQNRNVVPGEWHGVKKGTGTSVVKTARLGKYGITQEMMTDQSEDFLVWQAADVANVPAQGALAFNGANGEFYSCPEHAPQIGAVKLVFKKSPAPFNCGIIAKQVGLQAGE